MKFRDSRPRFIIMIVLVVLIFGAFIIGLLNLQIGQGAYYKELSEQRISTTENVTAARGNVVDRNGEILVTNRNGYNVSISKALFQQGDQNGTILALTKLLDSYNTPHNDTLPLSVTEPFTFDKSTEDAVGALEKLFDTYDLEKDATPKDLLDAICDKYEILDSYTPAQKRIIAGVRYEMELREFSMSNPFVFAEDVSMETVIAVSERGVEFPSVSVETAAYREYVDPTFAPHLLGTYGKIWAEEYADLKTQGYKMSDLVGKEGIEKVGEAYLRGTEAPV